MATSGGYASAQQLQALSAAAEATAVKVQSLVTAIAGIQLATGTITRSVNAFAQLEKVLTLTKAVAEGTAAQMKSMESAVRNFALGTIFSATESANALYFLASAGFSIQQSMSAMNGVLLLAQATLSDVGTTADTVASSIAAFHLSAGDATRIANLFSQSINVSQASMEKLAYSMRQVAPVAASMGVSIEETTAALSILYNVGLRGEQAGTALRNTMTRILNPTANAQRALLSMGIATRTATGEARNLLAVLQDIAKAAPDSSTLKTIVEDEALPGAQALVRASSRSRFVESLRDPQTLQRAQEISARAGVNLSDINSELELMLINLTGTNAASRTAMDQISTLSGSFALANNALDEVAITIGEALAPELRNLSGDLTHLVQWFRQLDDGTKDLMLIFPALVASTLVASRGLSAISSSMLSFSTIATQNGGLLANLFTPFSTGVRRASADVLELTGTLQRLWTAEHKNRIQTSSVASNGLRYELDRTVRQRAGVGGFFNDVRQFGFIGAFNRPATYRFTGNMIDPRTGEYIDPSDSRYVNNPQRGQFASSAAGSFERQYRRYNPETRTYESGFTNPQTGQFERYRMPTFGTRVTQAVGSAIALGANAIPYVAIAYFGYQALSQMASGPSIKGTAPDINLFDVFGPRIEALRSQTRAMAPADAEKAWADLIEEINNTAKAMKDANVAGDIASARNLTSALDFLPGAQSTAQTDDQRRLLISALSNAGLFGTAEKPRNPEKVDFGITSDRTLQSVANKLIGPAELPSLFSATSVLRTGGYGDSTVSSDDLEKAMRENPALAREFLATLGLDFSDVDKIRQLQQYVYQLQLYEKDRRTRDTNLKNVNGVLTQAQSERSRVAASPEFAQSQSAQSIAENLKSVEEGRSFTYIVSDFADQMKKDARSAEQAAARARLNNIYDPVKKTLMESMDSRQKVFDDLSSYSDKVSQQIAETVSKVSGQGGSDIAAIRAITGQSYFTVSTEQPFRTETDRNSGKTQEIVNRSQQEVAGYMKYLGGEIYDPDKAIAAFDAAVADTRLAISKQSEPIRKAYETMIAETRRVVVSAINEENEKEISRRRELMSELARTERETAAFWQEYETRLVGIVNQTLRAPSASFTQSQSYSETLRQGINSAFEEVQQVYQQLDEKRRDLNEKAIRGQATPEDFDRLLENEKKVLDAQTDKWNGMLREFAQNRVDSARDALRAIDSAVVDVEAANNEIARRLYVMSGDDTFRQAALQLDQSRGLSDYVRNLEGIRNTVRSLFGSPLVDIPKVDIPGSITGRVNLRQDLTTTTNTRSTFADGRGVTKDRPIFAEITNLATQLTDNPSSAVSTVWNAAGTKLDDLSSSVGVPKITEATSRFIDEMKAAAEKFKLDWRLLAGIVEVESRGNPSATGPVNASTGNFAAGLMQLFPAAAKDSGITPEERFDPKKSIEAGASYLRSMIDAFDGNVSLGIQAYHDGLKNATDTYLKGIIKAVTSTAESKEYVAKVADASGLPIASPIPVQRSDAVRPVPAPQVLQSIPPATVVQARTVPTIADSGAITAASSGSPAEYTFQQQKITFSAIEAQTLAQIEAENAKTSALERQNSVLDELAVRRKQVLADDSLSIAAKQREVAYVDLLAQQTKMLYQEQVAEANWRASEDGRRLAAYQLESESIQKIYDKYSKSGDILQGLDYAGRKLTQSLSSNFELAADGFTNMVTGSASILSGLITNTDQDWQTATANMLRGIANVIIQTMIARAIMWSMGFASGGVPSSGGTLDAGTSIGGSTMLSARGNAFLGGRAIPSADGNVMLPAAGVLSGTLQEAPKFAQAILGGVSGLWTNNMQSLMGSNPIFGGALSSLFGSANGNVFSQRRVVPHGIGGLVSSNQYFPMAGGAVGSIAERGSPEAIVPLKRGRGGALGVSIADADTRTATVAPIVQNNRSSSFVNSPTYVYNGGGGNGNGADMDEQTVNAMWKELNDQQEATWLRIYEKYSRQGGPVRKMGG